MKETAKCTMIVIPWAKCSDTGEHRVRRKASRRDDNRADALACVGVCQAEKETWRDGAGKGTEVRGNYNFNLNQSPTTRGRKVSRGQGLTGVVLILWIVGLRVRH